jgi:hypothetical protein
MSNACTDSTPSPCHCQKRDFRFPAEQRFPVLWMWQAADSGEVHARQAGDHAGAEAIRPQLTDCDEPLK